jgi:hypothetical protein
MKDKVKTIKISQSLLKSLFNFRKGDECGLKIYKQYVENQEVIPTSEAMNLGNWFEYECTGQLPRTGIQPQPETLKNGDLSIAYRRMQRQVENYKKIISRYEIDVIKTGYVFQSDKYSGIADIVADWDGKRCIIDLKTTGRIDDKWSEYGWGDEKFENPDSIMAQFLTIQAVQYKVLAREEWGDDDVDFYFFVFSTTDENAMKIFKVDVDVDRLDVHKQQLDSAYSYVNQKFINQSEEELALPNLKRCQECLLNKNCKHQIDVPLVKTIQVS